MPTTYKDQFFTVDPGNPPPVGTALNFQRFEYIDADDDGLIEPNAGETFDGTLITSVWENDSLTVNVPGLGNITYTGVTFYLADGRPAVFTPTDGQVLQNGTFVSSTFVTSSTNTPVSSGGPTCFTPGTLIDTPNGRKAIETLKQGDLITTMDHGDQPIRAIAVGKFNATSEFAPIRISKGALGNDTALEVSPQHRMLVRGWRAEIYFGVDEILVAAKHLVNGDTICRAPRREVTYIHLLFDTHQIVYGAGIPSESLFPDHVLASQDDDARAKTVAMFPEMAKQEHAGWQMARTVAKKFEATLLVH